MSHNEQNLILTIWVRYNDNRLPINVCLYDTPLQLAYKFCQDNKIPLSEFRRISQSIVMILKSATESDTLSDPKRRQLQECFAKFFLEIEAGQSMPYRDVYTYEELVGHNEQPSTEEPSTNFSFRNDQILQQKLYEMYILSPDKAPTTDDDCSSKRLKQLSILQQILGESMSTPLPLFETRYETVDMEQSFQKVRIPSIAASTVKHTTPSKTQGTLKKLPRKVEAATKRQLHTSSSKVLAGPNSQSPIAQRAVRPVQPFVPTKSRSPLRNINKALRPNTSYFQSSPAMKVQHLLQRLIYGKKRTNTPKHANHQRVKTQENASVVHHHEYTSQHQADVPEDEEIENLKSQQLYRVFQAIDSDRDGLISPQKIELSHLSDQILKQRVILQFASFLLDLLYEIDHHHLEVNFRQFCRMFEKHYQRYPARTKQQFLTAMILL